MLMAPGTGCASLARTSLIDTSICALSSVRTSDLTRFARWSLIQTNLEPNKNHLLRGGLYLAHNNRGSYNCNKARLRSLTTVR